MLQTETIGGFLREATALIGQCILAFRSASSKLVSEWPLASQLTRAARESFD